MYTTQVTLHLVLHDLVVQPLLQFEVLSPRRQTGEVDDEGEGRGLQQERQCLQILRNVEDAGQVRLVTLVPIGHRVHEQRAHVNRQLALLEDRTHHASCTPCWMEND